MQYYDPSFLVGKKILSVDSKAFNAWNLEVEDPSCPFNTRYRVTIDTERGLLGIPALVIMPTCLEDSRDSGPAGRPEYFPDP